MWLCGCVGSVSDFSLFTPTAIRSVFRLLVFSNLTSFSPLAPLARPNTPLPYLLALFTLALPAAVNCVTYAHAHSFSLYPTLPLLACPFYTLLSDLRTWHSRFLSRVRGIPIFATHVFNIFRNCPFFSSFSEMEKLSKKGQTIATLTMVNLFNFENATDISVI